MSLLIHHLKYQPNSAVLFSRLRHKPWAILLDSGQPQSHYGRYDIMVADPFVTVTTLESNTQENSASFKTEICDNGEISTSFDDPFAILNKLMAPYQSPQTRLPFCGGALGYFAYDLARQVEVLPNLSSKNKNLPHMMVGIYDWAVVIDHREKTACLVSHGFHPTTHEKWTALCAMLDQPEPSNDSTFVLMSEISRNMDFGFYATAFNAIKRYILEGDCYQVNLAQRFSAKARGDGWVVYKKLKEISPAPFMSYMNFGRLQVISGSPERFLQVVDGHVETRPIKGTRPRSGDEKQDAQYAQDLQTSTKDRAENLMIVDLLRNDISKNCETGSVKADKLFLLQSFANVHHLVSIVTGTLKKGKTPIDILRGCFPGGSITGAPKLRSMQIIEELEPHRRGVYCGSIGYIGFDGNMDTNIAIRTAVYLKNEQNEGEISFYAGGGIVADSVLEKEYAETLDKASSILKTMQFFSQADKA